MAISPIIQKRKHKRNIKTDSEPAMPGDPNAILRQLTGMILQATELNPDDDNLKKLADFAVGLVMGDPGLVRTLLKESAESQQQQQHRQINPVTQQMLDNLKQKQSSAPPPPTVPAAAANDPQEALRLARQIVEKMENEQPRSPTPAPAPPTTA